MFISSLSGQNNHQQAVPKKISENKKDRQLCLIFCCMKVLKNPIIA